MGNKLYVGNLPYSVRDSDLEQAFGQFGTVTSAKVMMERDTGRSKGFGFVEMASDADAQSAINGMNGQPMGGRGIVVNEARPMEPRPPRSGGFGGGGGGYGGGVASPHRTVFRPERRIVRSDQSPRTLGDVARSQRLGHVPAGIWRGQTRSEGSPILDAGGRPGGDRRGAVRCDRRDAVFPIARPGVAGQYGLRHARSACRSSNGQARGADEGRGRGQIARQHHWSPP